MGVWPVCLSFVPSFFLFFFSFPSLLLSLTLPLSTAQPISLKMCWHGFPQQAAFKLGTHRLLSLRDFIRANKQHAWMCKQDGYLRHTRYRCAFMAPLLSTSPPDIFPREGEQYHYISHHPQCSLFTVCLQCRAYLMIIKRIINAGVIISGNGRQALAPAIVIIDADQKGLNFIM